MAWLFVHEAEPEKFHIHWQQCSEQQTVVSASRLRHRLAVCILAPHRPHPQRNERPGQPQRGADEPIAEQRHGPRIVTPRHSGRSAGRLGGFFERNLQPVISQPAEEHAGAEVAHSSPLDISQVLWLIL